MFTGAGGLDLGFEASGFDPALCVEIDPVARTTLATNRPNWRLSEPGDITKEPSWHFREQAGVKRGDDIVVVGGPVCQPFSSAARWVTGEVPGLTDPRTATLSSYFDLVACTLPRCFLIENVAGLGNGIHSAGEFIRERINDINDEAGTGYVPFFYSIDSSEFGVPQRRLRTLVIAERAGAQLCLPEPREPKTAWDAIGDLEMKYRDDERLVPKGKWGGLLPSIPEGMNYLWHTQRGGGIPLFGWRTRFWSFLLKLSRFKQSWTITASPGPATGPFHWDNRRLSPQELARLQTFPDDYVICGSYGEQVRQIGNAVPVLLAEQISSAIASQWFGAGTTTHFKHEIRRRRPPEHSLFASGVPDQYLQLVGEYPAHPGPGEGPRAKRLKEDSRA